MPRSSRTAECSSARPSSANRIRCTCLTANGLCVAGRPGGRPPSCVPLIVTYAAAMSPSTKMRWISYRRPPKHERSHSLVAAAPAGPRRRSADASWLTKSGWTSRSAKSVSPPGEQACQQILDVLAKGRCVGHSASLQRQPSTGTNIWRRSTVTASDTTVRSSNRRRERRVWHRARRYADRECRRSSRAGGQDHDHRAHHEGACARGPRARAFPGP